MVKEIGNYISIFYAAEILGITAKTIKRWYSWWEDDSYEKPVDLILPSYVFMDKRKTKYFHKDDIEMLRTFQILLNTTYRGVMADFNAKLNAFNRRKKGSKNND